MSGHPNWRDTKKRLKKKEKRKCHVENGVKKNKKITCHVILFGVTSPLHDKKRPNKSIWKIKVSIRTKPTFFFWQGA